MRLLYMVMAAIVLFLFLSFQWAYTEPFFGTSEKFDGRCPICKEQGIRSKVYIGTCLRTLMGISSYYDEDGNYHFKDPNITTCTYRCSNGHEFTENGR